MSTITAATCFAIYAIRTSMVVSPQRSLAKQIRNCRPCRDYLSFRVGDVGRIEPFQNGFHVWSFEVFGESICQVPDLRHYRRSAVLDPKWTITRRIRSQTPVSLAS